jgi:hypothetical protein
VGIGLDANLGSTAVRTSGGATQTLTTSASAAAGSRIVVVAANWNNSTLPVSATDSAGNVYTRHVLVSSGNERLAVFSARATDALAAGSTIVVTWSGSTAYCRVLAASFTGVSATDPVETSATSAQATSGTVWTSGTATTASPTALLFAAAGIAGDRTSSAASGWTEIHDVHSSSADEGTTSVYRVVSASGVYEAGGTWSASGPSRVGAIVAFRAGTS